MVRFPAFAVCMALFATASAAAQQDDALYRASFVVTGTGETNRTVGIARCFGDALVKLTGDQTVVRDRRYKALEKNAGTYVQSFNYRDLLAGRPMHDEQGSYDRPHALTVAFDRGTLDAAARKLGREPWLGARPKVVVFLAVDGARGSFTLAGDGVADRSADMRAAFAAAAERVAMPVAFPAQAELAAFTAATLPNASAGDIAAIARRYGDVAVVGHIAFSDRVFGWIAAWRMAYGGRTYRWGVRGVNFDAAFRNAMFGVAQIASGHGSPR